MPFTPLQMNASRTYVMCHQIILNAVKLECKQNRFFLSSSLLFPARSQFSLFPSHGIVCTQFIRHTEWNRQATTRPQSKRVLSINAHKISYMKTYSIQHEMSNIDSDWKRRRRRREQRTWRLLFISSYAMHYAQNWYWVFLFAHLQPDLKLKHHKKYFCPISLSFKSLATQSHYSRLRLFYLFISLFPH